MVVGSEAISHRSEFKITRPFVCQDVPVAIHPWVKRHYIVEMRTAPTRCSRNQPTNVWIWKFFSILASFQTDFFFAGGTINTSTTSAAGQGVLAPLGSLYCQQIVSQETWWRTWILWVYAPLWDCEGTFVKCLGNDAWKVSWFNQEDLWKDIYLARIRTSDLALFSPAVLQKKRLCVFFLVLFLFVFLLWGTQIWRSHDGIWSQVNLVQLGNISANADPSARSMACTFHVMRISKRPWETWMDDWMTGKILERFGAEVGGFAEVGWSLELLEGFKKLKIDGIGTSCGLRRSCLWRKRLLFTFTSINYIQCLFLCFI